MDIKSLMRQAQEMQNKVQKTFDFIPEIEAEIVSAD